MTAVSEIIGDYKTHIGDQTAQLEAIGIDRLDLAMLDHICYRVETLARYDAMQKDIGQIALLLDESEVSGRLISTFEFFEPLDVAGWRIPYLELPQPKEGSPYVEGLEHSEFVIVGSLKRFQAKYPNIDFSTGALDKPLNPELGLKLPNLSVKFHELQLGTVTRIEQTFEF